MSIKPNLNLKSVVGPRTKVIIWVTEKPMSQNDDLYHHLNYIFDGLLSKNMDEIEPSATALYSTKGFGKTLYLFRVHPQKIDQVKEEIRKKAEDGINSHALLAIDSDLESTFYKITREFEKINNLETHLTKDLVKSL